MPKIDYLHSVFDKDTVKIIKNVNTKKVYRLDNIRIYMWKICGLSIQTQQ